MPDVVTEPIPWLLLLQRLTHAAPTWGVWKGIDSALHGDGDIDSVASPADWRTIVAEYRGWSSQHGFAPVIVCTHVPGQLLLVACAGDAPTRLLQLDVYSQHVFRGVTLARAEELASVMELDSAGFRRMRPGAAAVLLLLHAGVRYGGRSPRNWERSRILSLARRDPEGTERLASIVGLPVDAVRQFRQCDWDQRRMLSFELRTLSRLVMDPKGIVRCVVFDYRRMRPCLLVRALEQGRCVTGDRGEWLRAIGRSHRVVFE